MSPRLPELHGAVDIGARLQIKKAEVIDVKPGQVAILRTSGPITPEGVARIAAAWREAFAGGWVPPLMILDGGMEITILRREEAPAGALEATPAPETTMKPAPIRLKPAPARLGVTAPGPGGGA